MQMVLLKTRRAAEPIGGAARRQDGGEPQRIMGFIVFASNAACCCGVRVCGSLLKCVRYATCHVLVVAVKTVSQCSIH